MDPIRDGSGYRHLPSHAPGSAGTDTASGHDPFGSTNERLGVGFRSRTLRAHQGARTMKSSAIVSAAVALALTAPCIATAQTAKDLVGTWKNTKNISTSPDGKTIDVFGPHGSGLAMFSADGHFVIVNLNPDTPKFAGKARDKGTADENKAAVVGGIGLFGTYAVTTNQITFTLHGNTF